MKRTYRYLFFRMYDWNFRVLGAEESPALNALLMFCFFIFLHFIIVCLVVQLVFKIDDFDFFLMHKSFLFAVLFLDLGTNYFLFFRRTTPTKILNEFSSINYEEEKSVKRNTTIYVLFVVVILVVSIFIFVFPK